MSESCSNGSSSYDPTDIVNAFHNIPHVDIDLKDSSSQFDITLDYFQAVIIWACVPILVCLCIFILMLVYYFCICCCCCCQEKKHRPKVVNISCAFFISLLIIFSLGLIGVAIYSEIALNSDIKSFIENGDNINDIVYDIDNEINTYNFTEVNIAMRNVITVINNTDGDSMVLDAAEALQNANEEISNAYNSISDSVDAFDYSSTIDNADTYETIRHWSVIGYLIFVAVFLVIVFLVVVCRSAVGLVIMLVLMGIVTFSVWIVTGGGLATVIILGDICYDPDTLLRNNTDNTQAEAVIDYFIVCDNSSCPSPFEKEFDRAKEAFETIDMYEQQVQNYVNNNTNNDTINDYKTVTNGFDIAQNISNVIMQDLTCTPSQGIHEEYLSALDNLCTKGYVFGVLLFSLVSVLALSLMILMCCITYFAGLLASTSNELDDEDFVAFDNHQHHQFSQRRSSYTEPYSNGANYLPKEEYPMLGRNTSFLPPKYTDVNSNRPLSGEYDHFEA